MVLILSCRVLFLFRPFALVTAVALEGIPGLFIIIVNCLLLKGIAKYGALQIS